VAARAYKILFTGYNYSAARNPFVMLECEGCGLFFRSQLSKPWCSRKCRARTMRDGWIPVSHRVDTERFHPCDPAWFDLSMEIRHAAYSLEHEVD